MRFLRTKQCTKHGVLHIGLSQRESNVQEGYLVTGTNIDW